MWAKIQRQLTQEILLTQWNDLYRRVCLVKFSQNSPRKFQIIFRNKTPPYRGNSGSAQVNQLGHMSIDRHFW